MANFLCITDLKGKFLQLMKCLMRIHPHPCCTIEGARYFNALILLKKTFRCSQLLEHHVRKANLIGLERSWLELVVPLKVEALNVTDLPNCQLYFLVSEVIGKRTDHDLASIATEDKPTTCVT